MVCCLLHTLSCLSGADVAQQNKDEVADIVIDEAPAPVEIDESPSVNDRESLYHLSLIYIVASYTMALPMLNIADM